MQMINYRQARDFQHHCIATLVNVLPPHRFKETHIPGALNIPFEHTEFAQEVARINGGKDMPVIVYGEGQDCPLAAKAAHALEGAGFTNVMCYKGGANEWFEKRKSGAFSMV